MFFQVLKKNTTKEPRNKKAFVFHQTREGSKTQGEFLRCFVFSPPVRMLVDYEQKKKKKTYKAYTGLLSQSYFGQKVSRYHAKSIEDFLGYGEKS